MFMNICVVAAQSAMCMMMMCLNDGSSPGVNDV